MHSTTVAMHPCVTGLSMVCCYEKKKRRCKDVGQLHHSLEKSLKTCLSPFVPCANSNCTLKSSSGKNFRLKFCT